MRVVNVVIPAEKFVDVNSVLKRNLDLKLIKNVSSYETIHNVVINFKIKPLHQEQIMCDLTDVGCGILYGVIDVHEMVTTRPYVYYEKAPNAKRQYRIGDRMPVEEIHEIIDAQNHLTFDYMALIAMASVISGAGLLSNSATTIIASMLVSPLMGPILSITFGLSRHDVSTVKRGLRNEAIGVVISAVVGLVMGLCAGCLYDREVLSSKSEQMELRGELVNLYVGVAIAAPSGVAVVLAVAQGGVNAIVGTAISASLLPPIVNAGIYLGLAVLDGPLATDNDISYYDRSWISFMLWFENFIVIVLTGFLTFRFIKGVQAYDKDDTRRETLRGSIFGSSKQGYRAISVAGNKALLGGIDEEDEDEDGVRHSSGLTADNLHLNHIGGRYSTEPIPEQEDKANK